VTLGYDVGKISAGCLVLKQFHFTCNHDIKERDNHRPAKYSAESRSDIAEKTGGERYAVGALDGVQSTTVNHERVSDLSLASTGQDARNYDKI